MQTYEELSSELTEVSSMKKLFVEHWLNKRRSLLDVYRKNSLELKEQVQYLSYHHVGALERPSHPKNPSQTSCNT